MQIMKYNILQIWILIQLYVLFENVEDVFSSKPVVLRAKQSFKNHTFKEKRSIHDPASANDEDVKITYLNDTNKQIVFHWIGNSSNGIICITNNDHLNQASPSSVYISYDDGDSFQNITERFKLPNNEPSTIADFYKHKIYHEYIVFVDTINRAIFTTDDYAKTITRYSVEFVPSLVIFHPLNPHIFAVLDEKSFVTIGQLSLTENFGASFRKIDQYVANALWIETNDSTYELVLERYESEERFFTILYTTNLKTLNVYAWEVRHFYFANDYLFTTKQGYGNNTDLYVSFKLNPPIKCVFDTKQQLRQHFIVDVTNNRALVAVTHANTISHLYASNDLRKRDVHFTLSLKNVCCYFEELTWKYIRYSTEPEYSFADVYKVTGLDGIFIATRILNNTATPIQIRDYFSSVITFDHGRSWQTIAQPLNQKCWKLESNCSLHFSTNLIFSDATSIATSDIITSESAPGTIIALGSFGTTFNGRMSVYISLDGGLSWQRHHEGNYKIAMGMYGGVFMIAELVSSFGNPDVLYSNNNGKDFEQKQFNIDNDRIYHLMSKPGEHSTAFTLLTSLKHVHSWIIIKFDLKHHFKRNCTSSDFKQWSPSFSISNSCFLGQKMTFERRISYSNCLDNRTNSNSLSSTTNCECTLDDFECDVGFRETRIQTGYCIRNTDSILKNLDTKPSNCSAGSTFLRTKGYRQIPGDTCSSDGILHSRFLPDVVPCPIAEIPDFLLYSQFTKISRLDIVTNTITQLPLPNLKQVVGIEFDFNSNCMYWSDVELDTINRYCLNGSNVEVLLNLKLVSVGFLAFDWISNNLYVVDTEGSRIELIRTDINYSGRMRRLILDKEHLDQPRGIALHPQAGQFYWTDVSLIKPSIKRANLDGTEVKVLFDKSVVQWPNSITIDFMAERIYWVDAKLDYIAYSNLDGTSGVHKIITGHTMDIHPFSVTVFKHTMYWTDWRLHAILTSDKDISTGFHTVLRNLSSIMDVKIIAHGLQIGTNACKSKNPCSHICVGAPNGGYKCLCPNGFLQTKSGTCLCPELNIVANTNLTCPKNNGFCTYEQFACKNDLCIPNSWRCNGIDDCGDNSDELICQHCQLSEFKCTDGTCILSEFKCDYHKDCPDGSDEENCSFRACGNEEFRCTNGKCVPNRYVCDYEDDCGDRSDELHPNCTRAKSDSCLDDEFDCDDEEKLCIPKFWVCDMQNDCKSKLDEKNCTNSTRCKSNEFSCGSPYSQCIPMTAKCNNINDCLNGFDEKGCSTPSPQVTVTPDFKPKNICAVWMFQCFNQKCIPMWWKCDGTDDCNDGSDEIGCSTSTTLSITTSKPFDTNVKIPACKFYEFRCNTGFCIFHSWTCDGEADCPEAEDETNCPGFANCTDLQFKCTQDGSCIDRAFVCNSEKDCPDGSDELDCEHGLIVDPVSKPYCDIGYFSCDGNRCFPLAFKCDGKSNCLDESDEFKCNHAQRIYQVLQMRIEFNSLTENSLTLLWFLPSSYPDSLEFLPSISEIGKDKWLNLTWSQIRKGQFDQLHPYTTYNLTVFVRDKGNRKMVFPPAKYVNVTTLEGVPSPPLHVKVIQKDNRKVSISWSPPIHPNGIIILYHVFCSPPWPPFQAKTDHNNTYILEADFVENTTYSFYLSAQNGKYTSEDSEITALFFDGSSVLKMVKNLRYVETANNGLQLKWDYYGNSIYDTFVIHLEPKGNYPNLPTISTKTTDTFIQNLAPGVLYHIIIQPVLKSFYGPENELVYVTPGKPLPEIKLLPISVSKRDQKYYVNLTWNAPTDLDESVNWVYGIYYGVSYKEMIQGPKMNTTKRTVSIVETDYCRIYMFTIGIVSPFGYGPLSKSAYALSLNSSSIYPPKDVVVLPENGNGFKMYVGWNTSCIFNPTRYTYIIKIYERNTNNIWHIETEALHHVFNITRGGIYDVSIGTTDPKAIFTANHTYIAPVIYPPRDVRVFTDNNGKYIIEWSNSKDSNDIGSYGFEVLVCQGDTMQISKAQRFRVKDSPFYYSNSTYKMYSFAVRIYTASGYVSLLSQVVSITFEGKSTSETSKNFITKDLSIALGSTLTVLMIAIVLLIFYIRKQRRLQSSLSHFENSHYDTVSGEATFDDTDILGENQELPDIYGFSDDEPLLIQSN